MKTEFIIELPDEVNVHQFASAVEKMLLQTDYPMFSISYPHPQKGGRMCISRSRPSVKKLG